MLLLWPLDLSIYSSSLMVHERMLEVSGSSIRSCSNLSPKVTLMQLVLTAPTLIKVVQHPTVLLLQSYPGLTQGS